MRAYELARAIGVTSKELLAKAKEVGIPLVNQLKTVTEEEAQALRSAFASAKAVTAPKAAAPPPAARPPVRPAPSRPVRPAPPPKAAEAPRAAEAPKAAQAPKVADAPKVAEPAKAAETAEAKRVRETEAAKKGKVRKEPEEVVPAPEEPEVRPRRRRSRPRAWGDAEVDVVDSTGGGVPAPAVTPAPPRRPRAVVRRPVTAPRKKPASLVFPMSLREFSNQTGVKADRIISKLLERGTPRAMNDLLQEEEAVGLAKEFGVVVEAKKERDEEQEMLTLAAEEGRPEDLVLRAPVVTLMGHVDHGKTSLLDRIRQSNIAGGEFGGITQHIGAYRVQSDGHTIVFLDTPGHEAFTAMRARGAQVTDLVVLVVAADDGVMPQTEEAISHARAAAVPIVVAINKVDRPDANVLRVKNQLSSLGFLPEEWGGQTIMVETSAVTGQGISQLLEMLALEAELLELRANPTRSARGAVLEARVTAGRGVVATVLVQDGVLRVGDVVLCGTSYGRVRSLTDDRGEPLTEAGPAMPLEVTGLAGVPEAGDRMYVLSDIQKAKEIAAERDRRRRLTEAVPRRHVTLQDLRAEIEAGQRKELAVVVKADVQGSLEVIKEQLAQISSPEVRLNVLHAAVGDVGEGDVLLADASDAVIIGFMVAVDPAVAAEAHRRGVEVRLYRIIYELTDEVRRALAGLLEPERREVSLGEAEVRQLFAVSRVGTVAGCLVTRGVMRRNARVRLRRGAEVVFDGALESLRRFKNDASEVAEGYECGIKLAGFNDVHEGDRIEAYAVEEVARTL
jgi:translation initiation factor IF-2